MRIRRQVKLTAGDAVWVATALLHQENPDVHGFTVKQIEERVRTEHLDQGFGAGTIYQHAQRHCVANRTPNKSKLCLLTELDGGLRKLYRAGDPIHRERQGQPTLPHRAALMPQHQKLLEWYDRGEKMPREEKDWNPFADMKGTWTYGPADDYINALREGWDDQNLLGH